MISPDKIIWTINYSATLYKQLRIDNLVRTSRHQLSFISSIGVCPHTTTHHSPIYHFLAVYKLPVVRSEHVRTFWTIFNLRNPNLMSAHMNIIQQSLLNIIYINIYIININNIYKYDKYNNNFYNIFLLIRFLQPKKTLVKVMKFTYDVRYSTAKGNVRLEVQNNVQYSTAKGNVRLEV